MAAATDWWTVLAPTLRRLLDTIFEITGKILCMKITSGPFGSNKQIFVSSMKNRISEFWLHGLQVLSHKAHKDVVKFAAEVIHDFYVTF